MTTTTTSASTAIAVTEPVFSPEENDLDQAPAPPPTSATQ
jgi:hypothetical protein